MAATRERTRKPPLPPPRRPATPPRDYTPTTTPRASSIEVKSPAVSQTISQAAKTSTKEVTVTPPAKKTTSDTTTAIPQSQAFSAIGLGNEIKPSTTTTKVADHIPPAQSKPLTAEQFVATRLDVNKIIDLITLESHTANIQKYVNADFDDFSRNYANGVPNILFISEYYVEGNNIGCLIVFEKYFDSSHYEVFKRNVFSDDKFQRILFLDAQTLEAEKKYYESYIKDFLNIDLQDYYVIFDPIIKHDRIYEYKIRASRLPTSIEEVDFDTIFESKNLLNKIAINVNAIESIFKFAGNNLGSTDLAWTIALVNQDVEFFGRSAKEKVLGSYIVKLEEELSPQLFVVKNTKDIMEIIYNALSLFDFNAVFKYILKVLGGLSDDFKDAFIASLDKKQSKFSYDIFISKIKEIAPIFTLVLTIAESKDKAAIDNLSLMGIVFPQEKGLESLGSIESLSKIFKTTRGYIIRNHVGDSDYQRTFFTICRLYAGKNRRITS